MEESADSDCLQFVLLKADRCLSVFALHTKSEETLVSSWIDFIAFASSGAMLSTLILFNSQARSRKGIVFVTTICSMSLCSSASQAPPESTGCVKQAWMRSAPAFL